MNNKENIYCAYDTLNPTYREDGTEKHWCEYYNSYLCIKCPSRYDGDKIKKYIEETPRIEH